MMSNILALDLGTKRIGMAIAHQETKLATPLGTVLVRDKRRTVEELQKVVHEHAVCKIVVGLPKTMSGEIGIAAEKVMADAKWYQSQIDLEWVFWDERLTTKEVERILINADVSRKKRREVQDSLAAQRILQSYLDSNR